MKGIFLLAVFLVFLASAQATNYIATLFPTATGGSGNGSATFTTTAGAISCTLTVCGLTASKTLGFHIHDFGDMSLSNGNSAGSHFNPYGVPHGCAPNTRHVGDLGNITTDANGCGTATVDVYLGSDDPTNKGYILGRGFIVHSAADNCGQPTGNAGSRLLYGVIGLANTATVNYPASPAASIGSQAIAVFRTTASGTAFSTLKGSIAFTPQATNIWVFAYITGLTPNTKFPMHIHQFGDLTDTTTVGSHFDPYTVGHGCPVVNATHHTGDMGNFMTDADGTLVASFTIDNATLSLFAKNSIVGRAVVIHAHEDDCAVVSSAGARLAFGVIGFRQPTLSAEVVFPPYSHLNFTFAGTAVITPVIGGLGFYLTTTGFNAGSYGLHIHEYADTTAANGANFGGHFNPTNAAHGCLNTGDVGDLGNLVVSGTNPTMIVSTMASLDPNSPNYIIGRGMSIYSSGATCGFQEGYIILPGVIGIKNNSPAITIAASSSTPGNVNAVCVMQGLAGTAGANIAGNITLTPHDNGGTYFYFYLSGFTAHAKYSIHVHSYGDLSSAAGSNTGSHFNPNNSTHGCPPSANRHVGDMGSFTADADGKILALIRNELGFLTANNTASLIGRGIIVHSVADLCTPDATFGVRIAQCAIGYTSVKTRYDPTPTEPMSSGASVVSWSMAAMIFATVVALFNQD